MPVQILAFVTDAYGGCGGIAKYNRDLLASLCEHPDVDAVVALPRLAAQVPGALPRRLLWVAGAIGGKAAYARETLRHVVGPRRFDLVLCGHVHLLPFAVTAARRHRAPVVLFTYGIDAWERTRRRLVNHLATQVDRVVSISATTLERFRAWSRVDLRRCTVLPNAFDRRNFVPGPKPAHLLEYYGLQGRRVLMTLGRMASTERYKGFDEVLAVLPALARTVPDVAYLVVGEGDDRPRLEALARALGVADRTIFTGSIGEADKADHYRLADAFVMPSRGEGFGFVFLEAMACGIPVVASRVDGSREAVRDGALGGLVDPRDSEDIRSGILRALERPAGIVPDGLEYFSLPNFRRRLWALLSSLSPKCREPGMELGLGGQRHG